MQCLGVVNALMPQEGVFAAFTFICMFSHLPLTFGQRLLLPTERLSFLCPPLQDVAPE